MPEREVVSNTSPLLYLHQVGQLDLLHRLYEQVIVPAAVRDELRAGAVRGVSTPEVDRIPWLISLSSNRCSKLFVTGRPCT